ncbi:MAG: sulfate ABC transporter substrate-binding protein [Actinobacteria bacterium]|nr:MAG: sulfate ABC transporter substrate-binding protein [Actinomycetota bacterium]
MKVIWIALVGVALVAGSASGASKGSSVDLVAYSTPKDAYGKIIGAFQGTAAGSGVGFTQSYGASGDQARAVAAGQPADLVALSLDPDVNLLVQKHLVPKNWRSANRYHGVVSDSVVVFVVRSGNPKHVTGWGDLVKPGVQVITPNPFTSGGARWNVMAAYGALRRSGKTDKQAIAYLSKLFHHVPVQPASAREALQVFAQGKGDVLLTYQDEAIYAEKKGVHTEYHVPKATLLIETPVALTKTGLTKPAAKAFFKYLWSSTAQRAFGDQGFQPVVKSVAKRYHLYHPPGLFTIRSAKLGLNGWPRVNQRFFDPKTGVMAKIEASLGH